MSMSSIANPPTTIPVAVVPGEPRTLGIECRFSDSQARDLTGWRFEAMLARDGTRALPSEGEAALDDVHRIGVWVTHATEGRLTVDIPAAVTFDIEGEAWEGAVIGIDPGGRRETLAALTITTEAQP